MSVSLGPEGLTVKKLFKSIVIPYSEIRSIKVIDQNHSLFRTFGKEEYTYEGMIGLEDFLPHIYDLIVENDISYQDAFVMSDKSSEVLGEEETQTRITKLLSSIREEAGDLIGSLLGKRYDLDLIFKEIHHEKTLYMRLLRDGKVAADVASPSINYPDDGITDSFDHILMAFLCEWDPQKKEAKYVMSLDEAYGFEEERAYLLSEIRSFCKEILEENSKEYLETLS